MGTVGFLTMFIIFRLKETKDKPLEDFIEEERENMMMLEEGEEEDEEDELSINKETPRFDREYSLLNNV